MSTVVFIFWKQFPGHLQLLDAAQQRSIGEFLSMFSGVGAAVPNGADPIDAEEEARRLGISGPITTSLFKRWNTSARRQGLERCAQERGAKQ